MLIYLNRVFSLGTRFYLVKDIKDNELYTIQREFISLDNELHVYDMNGLEVACIRRKMFTWTPHYYIEINGSIVCEIVKKLTLYTYRYRLYGLTWKIVGDEWGLNNSLVDGKNVIMHMRLANKKRFSLGDGNRYELDIQNPEHELLCLCVALAIDCAMESEKP